MKDLKTESHNEAAADDHEEHVQEEVPVVVVSDTVVEPGTVVVHLEDAGVADTVWQRNERSRHVRLYFTCSDESSEVWERCISYRWLPPAAESSQWEACLETSAEPRRNGR